MISIIVPVYNIEDYLRRCLDSILTSTYKDYELILVDDGSTDSSGLICDEYAERDKRISVIHQKNKGLSPARNSGLKRSKGDYILMIDGDDCIHMQMIEILYKSITSGDYDFSMCLYQPINNIEIIDPVRTVTIDENRLQPMSQNDCLRYLYLNRSTYDYFVVWNKLYRRELLKGIFFNHDASQDTEFNNKVYQRVKKAVCYREQLYFYIKRSGSFQNRPISQRFFDPILTVEDCLKVIPEDYSLYRAYCLRYLYKIIISKGFVASQTSLYPNVERLIKSVRERTIREFKRNKNIPFFEKHLYILLSRHLKLNNFIWNVWVFLHKFC